ncbi:MAG: YbjN domain-containing protein [Deltaproteobacteria bacterium]|nr:YbjN domain-containing protein [Deltaproteobacteria bacterium]
MTLKKLSAYSEETRKEIEDLIENYVEKYFGEEKGRAVRIRHNIWTIKEDYYSFNIIITSLLVIFDAVLFEGLPQEKYPFFQELLSLNAHHVKSSKLCLVKDTLHLRIIRGVEGFDFSEFKEHIEEFREIYPEIFEYLLEKYYPDDKAV